MYICRVFPNFHSCDEIIEKDEHGVPVRVIGAKLDINERKKAEETLKRAERRLKETKSIEFYENLDELPFPAYHLIDMETFFDLRKKRARFRALFFSDYASDSLLHQHHALGLDEAPRFETVEVHA